MGDKSLSLGIDTSNYRTSVAVVDEDKNILFNHRQLLNVKKGERGLRQSDALFQHVQNLPQVFEKLFADEFIREHIGVVTVSEKPRPVEGSYMPVFTAGLGYGRAVAAALDVPLHTVSHQEGHIEAIRSYSEMDGVNPLICFHFSGGTTEAILVDELSKTFEIVGGSKDLAFGQVLDRIGVALGYDFPSGEALDKLACSRGLVKEKKYQNIFTPIKVNDCFVNLSGIETQGQRAVLAGDFPPDKLVFDLFETLSASILKMTFQLSEKYNIKNFIYAGGVSCSKYIRDYLSSHINDEINIEFGKNELSSDNAVGVALLGGKKLWL